jgi:hypothetical protein
VRRRFVCFHECQSVKIVQRQFRTYRAPVRYVIKKITYTATSSVLCAQVNCLQINFNVNLKTDFKTIHLCISW